MKLNEGQFLLFLFSFLFCLYLNKIRNRLSVNHWLFYHLARILWKKKRPMKSKQIIDNNNETQFKMIFSQSLIVFYVFPSLLDCSKYEWRTLCTLSNENYYSGIREGQHL